MKGLFENLKQYKEQNVCPMHMPGHKRNVNMLGEDFAYDIDITEIDGFDNLHNAQGILKQSQENASKLFGSKSSYYLVNGSTCGLISAIRAVTKCGDKIIIARNCHKSVYNAISLCRLKTAYIGLQTDCKFLINQSIEIGDVKKALEQNPDAKAMLITSPSYDGVVSNIKAIAKACHEKDVTLIVDEAHGAHLGMNKYFPQSAIECGADVVVQSLHKTLPALTQCAIMHVCSDKIDEKKLKKQLAIFQTSSPSYILLASIDRCVNILSNQKDQLFKQYVENLKNFSKQVKDLQNISVMCYGKDKLSSHKGFFDFDMSKIVISTINTSLSGQQLMDILRDKYKIELEMAQSNYAIAMTSICDCEDNFNKLASALLEIDKTVSKVDCQNIKICNFIPNKKYEQWEVEDLPYVTKELNLSVGQICAEKVWVYPPGVPIITEGEIIDQKTIDVILEYQKLGLNVTGTLSGNLSNLINVVDNK